MQIECHQLNRYHVNSPIFFRGVYITYDAVAKVGDTWEGTYTVSVYGIDEGTVKVTSEILGVEDVSVPAGNFADCFKVEVAALDPTDDSLYWKETWWLAEGVGLVKIVNSSESEDDEGFFALKGETRQLLGYHITPSDLTDDEKLIKELRGDFSDNWEQEDLAAIDDLYADSWSSRCKNKTERMQEFADSFAANENIANFASISDIVINGDEAKCMIQRLSVGIGDDGSGSEWASWSRSTAPMIKEGSEWKYYGDQIGFQIGWMFAWTRKYADESRFLELSAAMEDCAGVQADKDSEITSLTVTGPPGTFTDLDLAAEWNPNWLEYWLEEDISKAKNGFYTFRLVDYLGNILETTDYLVVMPPLDIPNLVSPIDGATTSSVNVTLDWDPVDRIDYYRVDLDVWDTDRWRRTLMTGTTATQVDQRLAAGTDYRWRVRPRQEDMYESYYDNESMSGWERFSTP